MADRAELPATGLSCHTTPGIILRKVRGRVKVQMSRFATPKSIPGDKRRTARTVESTPEKSRAPLRREAAEVERPDSSKSWRDPAGRAGTTTRAGKVPAELLPAAPALRQPPQSRAAYRQALGWLTPGRARRQRCRCSGSGAARCRPSAAGRAGSPRPGLARLHARRQRNYRNPRPSPQSWCRAA